MVSHWESIKLTIYVWFIGDSNLYTHSSHVHSQSSYSHCSHAQSIHCWHAQFIQEQGHFYYNWMTLVCHARLPVCRELFEFISWQRYQNLCSGCVNCLASWIGHHTRISVHWAGPCFSWTHKQIYGLKWDTFKTVCTLSYPLYFGTSNTRRQRGSDPSQRSF